MLYTHNRKILPSVQSNEFLPPISIWTSLAGIFLLGSVGTGIILCAWIKYNVTVKAPATVRPIGEIRLVQPQLEGTIERILVKENQIIKEGDAIAKLNDEQMLIKKSQLQGNIEQSRLQIIQIDTQIKLLDAQIVAEKRLIEAIIASANADLSRNEREYQEREITTRSELLAAEATWQKANANLQKAQADLYFAKIDRDRYQELTEIGAIGRREFEQKKLVVEQTKSALEAGKKDVEIANAKVKGAKAAVNPTRAMVDIAEERISQETAKGESTITTLNKEKQSLIQRRVEIQTQLKQSQKELQQLQAQLKNTIIRATSDGIILKLNLRNPGQVVRVSEAIAEIAPNNAPLIIKAAIPTQDIQNVAVGQQVLLRIDACPYPDYGTLKGVVKAISPDAITPGNNNAETQKVTSRTTDASYFEGTIKTESLSFGNANHQCRLQSGMDAKAEIISQEETALQFVLRKARLITDL
ncbi:MAG: HlyD family efflux transporter periplasmic adaptor subunit [Gloeotrichia echinulata IR180]|jgi:HlyD family secretion protein|nr:HlyD family efflux transporter periplasmic adaptor subunit [Gloeotrichia echinulata DEX184]